MSFFPLFALLLWCVLCFWVFWICYFVVLSFVFCFGDHLSLKFSEMRSFRLWVLFPDLIENLIVSFVVLWLSLAWCVFVCSSRSLSLFFQIMWTISGGL